MNEEALVTVSARELWAKMREMILSEEFSVSEGGVDYPVHRDQLLAALGSEPNESEVEWVDRGNADDGVSNRVQDIVISRHVSNLIERGEIDSTDREDLGL
jgi:hypothetical protein